MKRLSDYYKEFSTYLKTKNRSPLTLRDYDSYFRAFVNFARDIVPEAITLKMVDDFEKSLLDKEMQPATRSYYLIFLRNFLKFITRQGINVLNYQLIELPKVQRKILPALNENEISALLKSCPATSDEGLRAKVIILFLLTSGARVAEIAGLKLTDLELEENRATIVGKGNKMRIIFFDDVTKFYLKKYLTNRKVFSPYVFNQSRDTGYQNKPISTRQIERLIEKYGKLSGISKPVHPHVLRRTFATRMLRKGVNIKALQLLMGHSQVETTGRYIFIEQDELKKIHQLAHKKATRDVKEKEQVIIGRESLQNLNGRINKILQTQKQILNKVENEEEPELPTHINKLLRAD